MFYPPDIEAASDSWGANCGPSAIAAILNRSLAETRPLLNDFEQRGYMNITHVQNALRTAAVPFRSRLKVRPVCGLVFIQWGGHEKKPAYAQYRFTHWIAVLRDQVFDVNLPTVAHWNYWQKTLPSLMKDEGQGDGTFFIRSAIEILSSELSL